MNLGRLVHTSRRSPDMHQDDCSIQRILKYCFLWDITNKHQPSYQTRKTMYQHYLLCVALSVVFPVLTIHKQCFEPHKSRFWFNRNLRSQLMRKCGHSWAAGKTRLWSKTTGRGYSGCLPRTTLFWWSRPASSTSASVTATSHRLVAW